MILLARRQPHISCVVPRDAASGVEVGIELFTGQVRGRGRGASRVVQVSKLELKVSMQGPSRVLGEGATLQV